MLTPPLTQPVRRSAIAGLLLLAPLVLTTTAVATFLGSSVAQASSYSNGTTRLTLIPNNSRGLYTTQINGDRWNGNFTITRQSSGAGHTYFQARFEDAPQFNPDRRVCRGNLLIDRTLGDGGAPGYRTFVRWEVLGGEGCPQVGQVHALTLNESLPVADLSGNFNASNANTYQWVSNGTQTWPTWRVVAAEGYLNCRVDPNRKSPVRFTYRGGDRLLVDSRLNGNAFAPDPQGQPWLKLDKQCYVRASVNQIQPLSE